MAPTSLTKPTFKERLDRLVEAAKDLGFHVLSHISKETKDKPTRVTLVLENDSNPNKLSPIELDVVSSLEHLGVAKSTAEAWVMQAVIEGNSGFDAIFRATLARKAKT